MTWTGLHPRDQMRPSDSMGEERVYSALCTGLPLGWSAWHSLRIRTQDALLGEGDFVFACPDRGMLVLEVKSGRIEQRDGRWTQNGRPIDKSPLDQANTFAHRLLERLETEGTRPPAFGTAVCFPDCEFEVPPRQDDLRGVVLGARDLPWLAKLLPSLLDRALHPTRGEMGNWGRALNDLWGETWIPRVPLGRRVTDLSEKRLQLDERQVVALEGLFANDRVLVSGGAGSGKTLLAAEAARREAAAGRRVALLCFTRSLSTWLRAQFAPLGIDVMTMSKLEHDIAEEAGLSIPAKPDRSFWADELPAFAADHAVPGGTHGWSAIVIDEAQDLTLGDWLLVEKLAQGRRLWAFQDEHQRFWSERVAPAELFGTRFQLPTAKRCPAGVQALANVYAGDPADEAAMSSAKRDGSLGLIECPSTESVPNKIAAEVDRLLSDGLAPQDIAIVSVRGKEAPNSICNLKQIGRHEVVNAESSDMGERLVVDTFLRWKGLERPAVILTDLPEGELEKRAVRMYVGLTRALVLARVVGTRAALDADPTLARLRR